MKKARYVRTDRREIARDLVNWLTEESDVSMCTASICAWHHNEFEFFTWAVRWLSRGNLRMTLRRAGFYN